MQEVGLSGFPNSSSRRALDGRLSEERTGASQPLRPAGRGRRRRIDHGWVSSLMIRQGLRRTRGTLGIRIDLRLPFAIEFLYPTGHQPPARAHLMVNYGLPWGEQEVLRGKCGGPPQEGVDFVHQRSRPQPPEDITRLPKLGRRLGWPALAQ
jgi:hypothetical protein